MTDYCSPGVTDKADQATTHSTPSTSAVDRLMAIPHIMNSILQYAHQDRPSLARLMRTNKNFYKEVGPLLYHTVAIWEETVDSFFLGSYKPCHCEECLTDLKERWGIDHVNGGLTEYGQLFSKPHGYGKYKNPAPRPKAPSKATTTPEASPSKSSTASSIGPKTPENAEVNRDGGNDIKGVGDGGEAKSTKGGKEDKDKDDDKLEISLPISKKDLLRCVRVLTLGSHHESACDIHCAQVLEYMQDVEILRIVETPCAPHRTFHICENCPGGSCPIIDALNPRKIVVRNVSGLPVPFPAMWKASTKTKEMVFVLPTKMIAYTGIKVSCQDAVVADRQGGPSEELLKSLLGQFTEVDVIRVVFWPEWDDSLTHHPLARKLCNDTEKRRIEAELGAKPLAADYIAEVMHALTKTRRLDPWDFHRPVVDFYGFATTTLSAYGRSSLVEEHKRVNGQDAKYDLHSLAKRSAMRKEIGFATNASGGGYVVSCCDDITWYTIANYKRKQFAAEISEWD